MITFSHIFMIKMIETTQNLRKIQIYNQIIVFLGSKQNLHQQLCLFTQTSSSYCKSYYDSDGNESGCTECISGYGLLFGQCYPPCPSGWVQTMPSYCINATVIQQKQSFSLCPTNATTVASGMYFICNTPPGSNCTCGSPCPAGYTQFGCYCSYGVASAEIKTENYNWLYIFAVIGMIVSVSAVVFTFYQVWRKNVKKEQVKSETGVEITPRRQNLIPERV